MVKQLRMWNNKSGIYFSHSLGLFEIKVSEHFMDLDVYTSRSIIRDDTVDVAGHLSHLVIMQRRQLE